MVRAPTLPRPVWGSQGYTLYLLLLLLLMLLITKCNSERERDDIKRMEVMAGGNLTLTCYAQPSHLRSYRWVYIRTGTKRPQVLSSGRRLAVGEPRLSLDTKAEDGKITLKLTLSDIRPYESGIFMCWRQGLQPDPQILLTVLEPGTSSERQVIAKADGPSEVKYGDPATFTCTITPGWPVKVIWLKNGVEIPVTDRLYTRNLKKITENVNERQEQEQEPANQLQATLSVATLRMDANFTCRIETEPPEERNFHVNVRIPRVVSLGSEPDKDAVEYGQTLSLTCIVSGSDSEVLWLKDGSELSFGPNFPGRKKYSSKGSPNMLSSTVYIESVSFSDNGHYVCYIPGASKDILINIEGRPARLLGVTGGNFFEDEPLILSCSTQYAKDTQQSTVGWIFKNELLDPSLYESRVYHSDYNVTVNELIINRAGEEHAGTYQCVTPYGSAAVSVSMFVPPFLSEPLPSELVIQEGEELQLACHTTGHPQPTVHWEKNTGEMWSLVNEVLDSDADINGVFIIPAISMDDAGKYRCAAKSNAGSFLAEIIISVERALPEVTEMVAPESVMVGDNFTIQCTVVNWDGEVEFVFQSVSLNSHWDSRYSVIVYPAEDSILQAYLIVREAILEDAGSYMCRAGPQASASVIVRVTRRPGEIVNIAVSPAIKGQDFFVSCTVRNWYEEVQFYHKGNILSEDFDPRYSMYRPNSSAEEVTHVLKITSATPEDEGTYQCYLDAYNTHTVEVVLKDPIQKVLGISATAAIVGQNFNVTCRVINWDEPVTFLFNDVVIGPDTNWRYSVFAHASGIGMQEVNHILSVSAATFNDSGSYECYTTPDTSASIIVAVWNTADVTLELQSSDRPNWKDSPTPINCDVRGVDPNTVTILFSHFDEPQVSIQNRTKMSTSNHLVNIAITDIEEETGPHTIFTLGFYLLAKEQEGLWSCEVLHPSGASLGSGTLFLEVAEPPEFINLPPKEVYEDEGADVYLNCSVAGSSETMVGWYRKGIPEPIVFGRLSAMLFIPGFTTTDEGSYYCRAALYDHDIQTNTVLKLRTPQPQVESLVVSPAVVGGEFTVTCTVSNWNGQVLFFHNREPANLNPGSRYSTSSQQQSRGQQHTTAHVLKVKHATLQDSGVVECFITPDIFGSASIFVKEYSGLLPTPVTIEEFGPPKPTLSLGRVVELRGPVVAVKGSTLLLTCLVSPVVQQDIVLVHDIYFLYAEQQVLTDDSRIEIIQDVSTDGSRLLYLRITQVIEEDGGEYQCATSTDPPAHSVLNVVIVPNETQTELPKEVRLVEPPHLPTTTEDVSRGGCEFPWQWIGDWYQTDFDQKVTIAVHEFGRSTCISSSGNNYLLQHLKKECYRCIQITEQHHNLLQYKKSKCRKPQDIDAVCSTINRNTDLHTMVRVLAEPFPCPFTGPRKFTYELPQGECSESLSEIISDKKTELKFTYASCVQSRYDAEIKSEEFHCVANWTDGNTHYLIGKLDELFLSLEERFRCFTYIREEGKNFVYKMSHANSARCGVLGEDVNILYKIFSMTEEEPLSLTGDNDTNLTVQPSQEVKLTCITSVPIDFDEVYFFRKYYLKWTREVNNKVENITFDEDVIHINSTRFSLETDRSVEGSTRYDLIISRVQVNDAGVYTCSLNNENSTLVTRQIFLSMAHPPQYDSCELPFNWTGDWWTADKDYTISENKFGESICTTSLGNNFLMKEINDCYSCFIITEKHHNIIYYQKSSCIKSKDLNTVCSTIENTEHVRVMVRKNSSAICPFTGSRSFIYQMPNRKCSERHSRLLSINNDTELLYSYNPCPDHTHPEAAIHTKQLKCVANWSEDSTHYFMGNDDNAEMPYECFTYKSGIKTDYQYYMIQTGTEVCADIRSNSGLTYNVFGESQEPEPPVIEENNDSMEVQVGDSIRLTCTSRGGLPLATLTWFRDTKELPSKTEHVKDISKAYLDITVEESDRTANYCCEASNFATSIPLNTTMVLTFQKDFKNLMESQVVAVEGQTAFLPCALTSEVDVKMDWFDADLDIQITSGNETLTQDATYYPYIKDGLLGLLVTKSFLDTTYSCSLNGLKLGNTTLVILPPFLLRDSQVTKEYFEETTTRLYVDEGQSATLQCSLNSSLPSTLVSWWHYPGSSLLTQGKINLAETKGYTLKVKDNSHLLTLNDAKLSHSGLYICQFALNELEIYMKNFTVYVEGLVEIQLGESASVRCYSPTGDWVKFVHNEEDILHSSLNQSVKYEWARSEDPDGEGAIITLTVLNTTEDDLGAYTCRDFKDPYILQVTLLMIKLEGESTTLSMPSPDEEIHLESSSAMEVESSTEATEEMDVTTEIDKEEEVTTEVAKEEEVTTEVAKEEVTVEVAEKVTTEVPKSEEVATEVLKEEVTIEVAEEVTTEFAREEITTEVAKEEDVTTEVAKEEDVTTEVAKEEDVTTEVTKEEDVTTEVAKEEDVTNEIAEEMITDVPEEVIIEVPEEETTEFAENVITEIAEEVTTEFAENVITEIAEEVTTEVAENVITEIAEEVTTEVAEEVTTEVAKEAEHDFKIIQISSPETTTTTTTTTTTVPPPIYEEVILGCEGHDPLDISWKKDEDTLLFVGVIDVSGIAGLSLTPNGDLVLIEGPIRDIRDDDTYTCYVYMNDGDVAVGSYHISLRGEETIVEPRIHGSVARIPDVEPEQPESIPPPDLQFLDFKEEEVGVLANSKRVGNRILEVLRSGGLNVRLLEDTNCKYPNETRDWSGAQKVLQECEYEARASENLLRNQSVFIGIDFFVELMPKSWFAVTLLHVHNIERNVSVNVFAPMVPVPNADIQPSQSNEETLILVSDSWWDIVQGADNRFGNGLTASILSLQESYLSKLSGDASP